MPNLHEAIRWYGGVLDFTVEQEWEIGAAGAKVAFLHRAGMRLEVFEVAGSEAMAESRRDPRGDLKIHGHKHVAFATSDLDGCRAVLNDRRIEIVLEVGQLFGRALFINDPFGNVLEFVEIAQGDGVIES